MRHAILILSIVCWMVPGHAQAQKRSYTFDEDPVRLGNKALDRGDLQEASEQFAAALDADYHPDQAHLGLAKIAYRQGRYEDAEPHLRIALELHQAEKNEDYPEARASLGLLLLQLGRDLEAEDELETVVKEDSDLWDAQVGLALLELKREEWEKARKRLEKGANRKGIENGEDRYHYGMALYALGHDDLDTAEKEAINAFTLNPSNPQYGLLVGEIYQQRGAPTLAIDAFETVRKSPGVVETAPMLHTLGGLYASVGRYGEARDSYMQAAQIDSTYAPALKDLADLFYSAKQYDNAAKTYLRYVLLVRNDEDALLSLSEACYLTARYDQAAEAAKTALQLDPGNRETSYAFFKSGIQSRDPKTRDEAAELWPQVRDQPSLAAPELVAMGTYQIQKGQLSAAKTTLEAALAKDPQRADAQFQLGVLALKTRKPREAIAHFDAAILIQPDQPIYHLNLGIAYFQANELDEAIPPIRRALALDEGLTVGRLLLAQALAAVGSLEEAETEFQRVLDAEPENAKALRGLGYCQIRNKDFKRAIVTYEAATQADPANADGWAGLGNAHLSAQEWDAAERAFMKARELDPQNATMLKGMAMLEEARPQGQ
jgi:superkiller protein 3